MSLPRYPKYKDSEVQWLGRVPEHWGVGRLKNLLAQRITDGPHTTPTFVDEGVPFLSVDAIQDGELRFEGCRYVSDTDHGEFRKKALPRRGDLLMGKAASTGKLAQVKVDFEFSIWSPLALIRLSPSTASPSFFEQWLKSPVAQAQIDNLCTANTQKNISMDDIPRLTVTLPPLQEQIQITAFLDYETSKIDALVAEQERLIELLKEKRQAVISHAVTKGLNPDVPMKDSGIEWVGQVPSHWAPIQVGRVCRDIGDGPHFSPPYVDEGVLFLSARNVKVDCWALDDVKYVSEADCREFDKRIVPEPGDVLYTKGGTTGVARVVDLEQRFQVWVHIAVLKVRKDLVTPHYLGYALNSIGCYEQSQLLTRGATNNDLGLTRMTKIWFGLPPLAEQRAIVEFLDGATSRLDTLTAEAQRGIDLLQERRTALISAAVTGQIDVREATGRAA